MKSDCGGRRLAARSFSTSPSRRGIFHALVVSLAVAVTSERRGTSRAMTDEELEQSIRRLRADGYAPKEIARALGVRPAVVAPLARMIASERAAAGTDPELAGCWVSPGWCAGLTVAGHPEWPVGETVDPETGGLVEVLVARGDRDQKVSVCGYLVDVYCLGVKNVLGPDRMRRSELPSFQRLYFRAWASGGVPAPIELARELVFGAVEYAHTLGFAPHPDFERARGHLGHGRVQEQSASAATESPSSIRDPTMIPHIFCAPWKSPLEPGTSTSRYPWARTTAYRLPE
jgi:hypothetical protein